ncbi:hypothetical protein EVAR_81134_1, partial [Eumeta japonica]
YHKTKWSTSLRSRHIVDLALSESDQSLRSPGPANPFASDPRSFVGAAISVILHIITTIQTSQNVKYCAGLQSAEESGALIPNGVSTDVEECTSGTKKLLMELGINKLGEAREILYVIEIEDTEHDIMSQVSNLAPFPASTIQPASTHQVITFPDVHVSADEDMPKFSDDDDAEYLVTLRQKEIQQNLSDDEELPPQVKKNNNEENVDDVMKELRPGGQGQNVGTILKCRGFDRLGTERPPENIPEDVKEMKKICEKGTIIALPPGDVMVGRMQNLIDD